VGLDQECARDGFPQLLQGPVRSPMNIQRIRKHTVTETKKSQATIPRAWFRIKVVQR
jgi:hypothetical protein